ncbi:MAG: hypothetical protein KAR11_05595 [Phycisphaerae bacterium]|nr:hypothetical protein [Phycisphaerae bacterium]
MSMEQLLDIPLSPPTSALQGQVPSEAIPVDTSKFSAEQLAAIPMANPILFQGIVSLVLIVIMLLMTGACVYLGVRIFSKPVDSTTETFPVEPDIPSGPANPFKLGASSPVVCGDVQIETPVVYCIDAGADMGYDIYPLARAAVASSIISLGDSRKFGVVVLQDDHTELIGGEMLSGGWGGYRAIKATMQPTDETGGTVSIGGATDLMLGIQKALACKPQPKTIVLIISCRYIEYPKAIAAAIKKSDAILVLVVFGIENDEQIKAVDVLVKEAGGNSQSIIYETKDELADMYSNSAVPE